MFSPLVALYCPWESCWERRAGVAVAEVRGRRVLALRRLSSMSTSCRTACTRERVALRVMYLNSRRTLHLDLLLQNITECSSKNVYLIDARVQGTAQFLIALAAVFAKCSSLCAAATASLRAHPCMCARPHKQRMHAQQTPRDEADWLGAALPAPGSTTHGKPTNSTLSSFALDEMYQDERYSQQAVALIAKRTHEESRTRARSVLALLAICMQATFAPWGRSEQLRLSQNVPRRNREHVQGQCRHC